MSRFCTLSSSSKGNCTYVSGGNTSLLVDVGISRKRVKDILKQKDVALTDIDGILITHEHSDHIKGLEVLLREVNIPVYSGEKTLEYMSKQGMFSPEAQLFAVDGKFNVGDIEITAFETPHDAVQSMGFRIEMPDGNIIGVATDLGNVTSTVRENLEGCDLVLLESNFDHGMLDCSKYPHFLKCRIRSENGHLANEDCAAEIAHLVKTGTSRFVLGHLSEENNFPELAYQTTKSILIEHEMQEGEDYLLSVAPATSPHDMVVF